MKLSRAARHPADYEIALYLAGDLPAARQAAIRQHLATCRRCTKTAEDQQAAQRALARLDLEPAIPPSLNLRLQTQLAQATGAKASAFPLAGAEIATDTATEAHKKPIISARPAAPGGATTPPPAPFPARRRSALKVALVAAVVGIIALVGGLLAPAWLHTNTASKGTPAPGTFVVTPTIAGAPIHSVIIVDFSEPTPACTDLLVADATVSQSLPSRWNTPDGKRPTNLGSNDPNSNITPDSIYTPVLFSSMRILLDHRAAPTQTFSTEGGTVGQDSIQVEGLPQLTVHERYLLIFTPTYDQQTAQFTGENRLIVDQAWQINAQGLVILQPANNKPGGSPTPAKTEPLAQIEHQLAGCAP